MFQVRLFVSAVAIATLMACGGQANPASPRVPAFVQTLTGNIAGFGTIPQPLDVSRSGELRLTLRWEGPGGDLDLLLTPASCVALWDWDCEYLENENGIDTNPEIIHGRRVRAGE